MTSADERSILTGLFAGNIRLFESLPPGYSNLHCHICPVVFTSSAPSGALLYMASYPSQPSTNMASTSATEPPRKDNSKVGLALTSEEVRHLLQLYLYVK